MPEKENQINFKQLMETNLTTNFEGNFGKNIQLYSRYRSKICQKHLLKDFIEPSKPFQKTCFRKKGICLDETNSMKRNFYNTMQPRVKLTRSQAPSTKKEQNMYDNVVDERQKKKPKIETYELTRTADKRKNICKVDSTSWNYESYSTTQAIHHTNPIQRKK